MSLTIREMEPRDIPAACELMRQLSGHSISAEEMQNRLDWVHQSPVDWLYVAESGGQVLGLFGFRLRENFHNISRYGEVSVIVTSAGARHQGIGQAMMTFAEQLAREKGCIGTWLVSGIQREADAHPFYKRLGYEVNGYRFVKLFRDGGTP
jgi:GNAT superfamily N-acetyltransferase